MMQYIIEDLESILSETNKAKLNLNLICEKDWDLLHPPGTGDYGSFKIEKNIGLLSSDSDKIVAANVCSSEEGLFENVDDLISYGKLIRNTARLEINKRQSKASPDMNNEASLSSEANKSGTNIIKGKSSSKQLSIIQERSSNRNVKLKYKKKSLHTQTNQACTSEERIAKEMVGVNNKHSKSTNLSLDNVSENKNIIDDTDSKRNAPGTDSTNNLHNRKKYSHSCSLSLPHTIKSLKLPEDLRYLLKRYYYYESNQLKCKWTKNEEMNNFKEQFSKHAKSKLENDLKRNIKEGERYMKYLEVADGAYKTMVERTRIGTHIQYRSDDHLCLHEARHHRLTELLLHNRLLNTMSRALSALTT